MNNKINWNYILLALGYKIKEIEQRVIVCHCCDEYTHKLEDTQNELKIYKEEYRKALIEQQKSNKIYPKECAIYDSVEDTCHNEHECNENNCPRLKSLYSI